MILFENDFYIVHHRPGTSSFILVTFTGIRAPELLDGTYFGKRPCDKLDITVIGIVAKTNSWYRADGILAALREASLYTTGYRKVYTYGSSSGAYAAIKYSGLLKASHTIALAPQYSLDKNERPGEATQFDPYYSEYMQSMGIVQADVSGKIYIVIDPACRDDEIHMQWIARNVDDFSVMPVFHADHVISQYIKGTDNLKAILSSIETPSALFRALSDARRGNAGNQSNIIKAAVPRHAVLAARALACCRCRRSGACVAFLKDRARVKLLLRLLVEAGQAELAGSLLHSALYGLTREHGEVDPTRHLYFTSFGEMVTFDPVGRSLSSTDDLWPRPGHQIALFSLSVRNTLSFGYHGIDGRFRAAEGEARNSIAVEPGEKFHRLRFRNRYLSAQPNGEIHANRLEPDLWEQFVPFPLDHVRSAVPPRRVGAVMLSRLATTRITAVGAGRNSIHNGADYTFIENWTVEGDFDHVRLIYMVDSADRDLKVGAASIAAMNRLSNNPPVARPGTPALTPVTFNNRGADADFADRGFSAKKAPAAPGVSRLELDPVAGLAPGQIAMVPKLYFSDWMPLASLRRVDGGPGRLIHVRTVIPHHGGMRGVTTSRDGRETAADPCRVTGRSYQTCFIAGQFAASGTAVPELDAVPAPAQGRGLLYGLQLIARRPGATLQMVGDSIGSGYGSTTNNTGFAQLAASIRSNSSLPVHFLQSATYAQPSCGFFAAARQDLDMADVSVAIIQTWSGNDVNLEMSGAQAQQAADAAWQRAMDYGQLIVSRGGVPIFLSAVPQKAKCVLPQQEAARLSSVTRCRELALQGGFVIDLNGELGDGGSPETYAPRFLLDGLHPNQTGQEHIAALLGPMLNTILGS